MLLLSRSLCLRSFSCFQFVRRFHHLVKSITDCFQSSFAPLQREVISASNWKSLIFSVVFFLSFFFPILFFWYRTINQQKAAVNLAIGRAQRIKGKLRALLIQRKKSRSFFLSTVRNKHGAKKKNWKPSSGRSQEKECYKRLIYKQFVQISGLRSPQFPSYFPKHFTHLCNALYGDAMLVDCFGRQKSTKTSSVHFFYKSSSFSLES